MAFQKTSGELERRRRKIVAARVLRIAQDLVAETVLAGAIGPEGAHRDGLLERVARRELAPHACARALLAQAAGRASSEREGNDTV